MAGIETTFATASAQLEQISGVEKEYATLGYQVKTVLSWIGGGVVILLIIIGLLAIIKMAWPKKIKNLK